MTVPLHSDPKKDCDYKKTNWKKLCSNNFHSPDCKKAGEIFRKSKLKGFAPDYTDDFWRKKALKEDPKCPPDQSDDCEIKKDSWRKLCTRNLYFQACKKAEAIFKAGLKEGFKINKTFYEKYFKFQFFEQFFLNQKPIRNVEKKRSAPTNNAYLPSIFSCKEAIKKITGDPNSPSSEWRSAYRKKALEVHPDKIGGNESPMTELNHYYAYAKKNCS